MRRWILTALLGIASSHVLAMGLGAISLALVLARRFGRFNGGNSPAQSE
jgi:hypothetical protein